MTKSVVRMSCAVVLLMAVLIMIWYMLIGSSTTVSPDAVLVRGVSDREIPEAAEETKDCFLLQEDELSV